MVQNVSSFGCFEASVEDLLQRFVGSSCVLDYGSIKLYIYIYIYLSDKNCFGNSFLRNFY